MQKLLKSIFFLDFITSNIAILDIKIAGWALFVFNKSSSGPLKIMLDKEIFMIYLEQEKYVDAVTIGSSVVENMLNSTDIEDKVLAETCYNVAICNRYLGYEAYNKIVDTINQGTDEKEQLEASLEEANKAVDYFSIAKERFYDASSFDPDDQKSAAHAKDINQLIKQIKKLFIPQIKDLIRE